MSVMSASECIRFCKHHCWSEAAIATIRTAEAVALQKYSDYIGTDHLLLALVSGNNSASILINEHDQTALGRISTQIEKLLHSNRDPPLYPSGDLFLTPRTETAIKTATNFSVATVGCEHILIALLFDADNVAHQVLLNVGFTYERLLEIAKRVNRADTNDRT